MSGTLGARLRRLEKARPDGLGDCHLWWEGCGSPEPEMKPGDTLLVVKLDDRPAARDPAGRRVYSGVPTREAKLAHCRGMAFRILARAPPTQTA